MKLSELQRRILELALVEYEKQPEMISPELIAMGFSAGESPRSRAIATAGDLVEKLYGIEPWQKWRRWTDADGKRWRARQYQSDEYKRRLAAARSAISKAMRSLGRFDIWDKGTWARRLSDKGAAFARDNKQAAAANDTNGRHWQPPAAVVTDSVTSGCISPGVGETKPAIATVTRCSCGTELDAKRSTRRYCSPACRQAAYRARTAMPIATQEVAP